MGTDFKMTAKLGILICLSLLLALSEGCLKKSSSGGSDPEPQGQENDNDKPNGKDDKSPNRNEGGDQETQEKKLKTFFLANCHKKYKAPYNGDDPELYISRDGGALEELIPDYDYGTGENVEISTDGEWIAYSKELKDKTSEIYVMKLSNKREFRITNNDLKDLNPNFINNEEGKPEWVVWFSTQKSGFANLFVRKIDLSEAAYNISPKLNAHYWDPEVSAQGDKIAYPYDEDGWDGCATVIQVADIKKDNGIISLANARTISGTNRNGEKVIARTDPAWNKDGTKILYDIYDVDVRGKTGECWNQNGVKDGYQQNWKIVLYDLKSGERKVVFESGKGDPANWLPIWIDDNNFLASGLHLSKESRDNGIWFKIYRINLITGERVPYRSDTDNCIWIDYVQFYE